MTDKNRKEKQEHTKGQGRNGPLYTLDSVSNYDWKLFMWFASLRTVENCIHLFIVVWNAIPVRGNADVTREFNEETNDMIRIVGEMNIPKTDITNYSKILDNYRNYRHSGTSQDQEARCELVDNVWMELESCGLKDYSFAVANQLKRCPVHQKQDLRKMVLSRTKSFRSFSRLIQESMKDNQIKEAKKDNHSGKKLKDENFNSQKAPDNKSKDDNQVKLLSEENEKLKSNIENLKKENARQQAALGNLTNVSWNDDDPNNTAKLISDIEELQDMLDDFTIVQGSDYKVNDVKAVNILKSHNCQVEYPNTKANLVLGAIFRRCAINTILEETKSYLQTTSFSDPNKFLERNIVNITENLIKHMKLFRDNREGDDDITKITPIKIRQHAYSALSCRGLPSKHPLIKEIALKLLNEMNKFREVVDEETKNELHDQAIQITCKVINIFYFRLKTQASEPVYRSFQAGDDLDVRLMQGAFSGQEAKNLEVEACGFPCIAIFDSDNSNPKVLTKAQVIARPKRSKSGDANKSDGDKSDDKGDDKGGDKGADKEDKSADKEDKSADKGGDKSTDKGDDKSADKGGDKGAGKSDDKLADNKRKSVNAKNDKKTQNRRK